MGHVAPRKGPTRLRRIFKALGRHYGVPRWKRRRSAMDCLILTVLSQNTNDRNSLEGFRRLKARYPTWTAAANVSARRLAEPIKVSGLSHQKSKAIKAILRTLRRERGAYSLAFLKSLPVDEARAWLRALPGVGPKTAACVLLFGFGIPVFPVDTHIHRVTKRLGLIENRTTAQQAHDVLQELTPDEWVYPLHILFIRHGREICRARRPECPRCVLLKLCPFGAQHMEACGVTADTPAPPQPQRGWSMWEDAAAP
jgi:endonuclease-3